MDKSRWEEHGMLPPRYALFLQRIKRIENNDPKPLKPETFLLGCLAQEAAGNRFRKEAFRRYLDVIGFCERVINAAPLDSGWFVRHNSKPVDINWNKFRNDKDAFITWANTLWDYSEDPDVQQQVLPYINAGLDDPLNFEIYRLIQAQNNNSYTREEYVKSALAGRQAILDNLTE